MPGTFNGTTLTISATPVDGAKIPDNNATNVAGIAIVGSDMYCVKTTGLKSTLYKTANYASSSATAATVKQGLNWFALGLTKIGNYLYMLAEDHKGYGGSTTIVKLDTAGNQLGTHSIKSICPNGALGITAADGTSEKFIIMHYATGSSAGTLTFSVVSWGKSSAEKKFTVTNSGYGYTTQLQDIYYHTSFGLFILTNNTFSTLQNRILVVDYQNTDSSGKKYVPSAVINVNKTGAFNQYNLESICMKANHLVLASNVVTSAGVAEDKFSVLEGITYAGKTYTFACGFKFGAKVPTKVDPNYSTSNLGCISFNNENVPYFVKQDNTSIAVLGHCANYMDTSAKVTHVKTFTGNKLGHANGMSYFNSTFYIVAGDTKVVALNNSGTEVMTYTVSPSDTSKKLQLKAINYFYEANTALLLSVVNEKLELYKCAFGGSANVNATYLGTLVNAGQPTSQDIFYHKSLGLFVATSNPHNVSGHDEKITTKNTLLHYNLNKLTTTTALHPDFGFVTDIPDKDAQGRTYNSFELESVALDGNNKMTAVFNGNVKTSSSTGLASTDGFFQYNTLDFIIK
ncbi:MAG: hypothetical protein Q4D16_23685 [Eubacteriales bacterium]|nr:hypothetical protein [Eubacteriales bacterium]